jgi:hypothetical protein
VSALQSVRETLSEFAAGLRLEEEELPSLFDADLLETAVRVEEAVALEFSSMLVQRSVALRLAAKVLVEDPSPDAMALVLREFGCVLTAIEAEMRTRPSSAEWYFARQMSQVVEHVGILRPGENPDFCEFPRLLSESRWLREQVARLAAAARLDVARTPASRGLTRSGMKRWFRRVNARSSGKLCASLQRLRSAVEERARQVWLVCRGGGEEQTLPQVYVYSHTELFPDIHCPLSENGLALEVAKLKGLALGLQLPDLALCLDSAEWMAHYALSFLVPPVPGDWAVRGARLLTRMLEGRLSRWYFCAFDHVLEPLEMTATVLRIGRPLFYERIAAHALLEYSLLQGVAFLRQAAPSWLDIHTGLEREFQTLFDGYLLRLYYYPRLKTPPGWCAYLAALHAVHSGGAPPDEFAAFRESFLARRGLSSSLDILYRTTESHSSVN